MTAETDRHGNKIYVRHVHRIVDEDLSPPSHPDSGDHLVGVKEYVKDSGNKFKNQWFHAEDRMEESLGQANSFVKDKFDELWDRVTAFKDGIVGMTGHGGSYMRDLAHEKANRAGQSAGNAWFSMKKSVDENVAPAVDKAERGWLDFFTFTRDVAEDAKENAQKGWFNVKESAQSAQARAKSKRDRFAKDSQEAKQAAERAANNIHERSRDVLQRSKETWKHGEEAAGDKANRVLQSLQQKYDSINSDYNELKDFIENNIDSIRRGSKRTARDLKQTEEGVWQRASDFVVDKWTAAKDTVGIGASPAETELGKLKQAVDSARFQLQDYVKRTQNNLYTTNAPSLPGSNTGHGRGLFNNTGNAVPLSSFYGAIFAFVFVYFAHRGLYEV